MSNELKKKVFLIISGQPERISQISDLVGRQLDRPVIYTAPSGNVGLLKMKNAAVDIVITDSGTNTPDSTKMVEHILLENLNPFMSIIIIGHPPEEEKFVDELVTGKIYFVDEAIDETVFSHSLTKALNFNTQVAPSSFSLRYLAAGEVLIKEGDKADFIYILKTGQLRAFSMVDDKKTILGNVDIGEFVGEMAYINNEPRTASIEAVTNAQLIEVPIGLVDQVLYKRPAWSKALMQTLSKRLKIANSSIKD